MAMRDAAEQVRVILLRHWDPIGVVDESAAQDEYDSYVTAVVRLVLSGATSETIANHLLAIEREQMGMPGNVAVARQVAVLVAELRR